MKKVVFLLLVAISSFVAANAASDVTVGNFVFNGPITISGESCYNLKGLSAAGKTVTGQLVVPGYVVVSGTRYRVYRIDGLSKSKGGQYSSVKVEYGVQSITRETFRDMTTLTAVSLPGSIESIGQMTFSGCSNLTRLYYSGESTMSVQAYTFEGTPSTKYLYTATRKGANVLKANSTWSGAFSSISVSPSVAYDFRVDGVGYVIKKGIPYGYSTSYAVMVGGTPTNGKVTLNQNIATGLMNTPGTYAVKQVADSAFMNNTNVTTVANSYALYLTVGRNAFYGCTNLTSVDLATDSIKHYAFYGCKNLSSITLHAPGDGGGPDGVSYIGNFAFGLCAATEVTIPKSVSSIGYAPFYLSPNLVTINVNSGNSYYAAYTGCLYSKDYSRLYQIPCNRGNSSLHPSLKTALRYCAYGSKYTDLALPYGFSTIEDYAFANMTGLVSIQMPSSVSSVGSNAFLNSSKISIVYLNKTTPPSTNYFPSVTKSNLKLYIPYDGFESYRTNSIWKDYNIQYANDDWKVCYDFVVNNNFYTVLSTAATSDGYDGLVSFVRPNNSSTDITIPVYATCNGKKYKVTTIGPFAFYNTPASNFSVSVANGSALTTVRDYAFFNNSNLKSFPFEGLTLIGYSAFSGTSGLFGERVYLTNAITLGEYAFSGSGISAVIIGKSLINLGSSAFRDCENLTEVIMSSNTNLNYIPAYCFSGCRYLNSFRGQNTDYGTTSINKYAFQNCNLAGTVLLPTGTRYIYDNAFENTQLESLEIPYGTTYVGSNAFLNSTKLKRLVVPATVTTLKPSFIKGCTAVTELVLNQKTPLSLWSTSNSDYVNYLNMPSGAKVYVPVGCASAYANNTSSPWYLPNIENYPNCITEGSYDFTDQFQAYKYDVVNYPSSANSYTGSAKLVYNPNTINNRSELYANHVSDFTGQLYRVTAIGDKAFYNSSQLKTFKYTAYLTEIGEYAFYNSALTNIYFDEVATSVSTGLISAYIERIGQYAFYKCSSLKELFFDRRYEAYSAASLGKNFFGNNHSSFKFYVDYHFYDQYATILTNWTVTPSPLSKIYLYTKLSSTYQSIGCTEALTIPSGLTCYYPSKYDKASNKVYLVQTDCLSASTGGILKGTVDTYYRFGYPSTYQSQNSLMSPVLGSNTYVNSNSTYACFSLNGSAPSFSKITSSTLYKTGNAYLKLAVSDVGSKTTVGYTFTDPGSGGLRGDINNDGQVNSADVSALYSAMLNGDTGSIYDLNNDGQINSADVSELYSIILSN